MRIDQLVVSASPGDAITDFAFELQRLLVGAGVPSSAVFARYFAPELSGRVQPLSQYGARTGAAPDADLLVFHASIGEPEVADFVAAARERLVVVYHNISPSAPFAPYDPVFAGLLDEGRRELARLQPRASQALAVSEFNAAELRDAGYGDVRVLPLIVDVGRLAAVEPHPPTVAHLDSQVEGPVALFVGQLLPHKRPDWLLEAYHLLVTYLLPDANLILVGPARLAGYHAAIQAQVNELNLDRAWVAGPVSVEGLAAFYRRADLFVTASEHEGFCVPLLEAMSFDLPVVARRFAAIPETAGAAALLLEPDDGPAVAAEALAAVLGPDGRSTRHLLVGRGVRRLDDFDVDAARAAWVDALLGAA
jgi:glycosyltransferase involved in cell wall biosynthesis